MGLTIGFKILALGFWVLGLLGVPGCEVRREAPTATDAQTFVASRPGRAEPGAPPLDLAGTRFDPALMEQGAAGSRPAPGARRAVTTETILGPRARLQDRRALIERARRSGMMCYIIRSVQAPPQALLHPMMIQLRLRLLHRLVTTGVLSGAVGTKVAADLLTQVPGQDLDTSGGTKGAPRP